MAHHFLPIFIYRYFLCHLFYITIFYQFFSIFLCFLFYYYINCILIHNRTLLSYNLIAIVMSIILRKKKTCTFACKSSPNFLLFDFLHYLLFLVLLFLNLLLVCLLSLVLSLPLSLAFFLLFFSLFLF